MTHLNHLAQFENEFAQLIEENKNVVEEKLIEGFSYYNRIKEKRWDPVTLHRKTKEVITAKWDSEKMKLVDAKEHVLPGIKRWLQSKGFDQFSDLSLAESLQISEIDNEIKNAVKDLTAFAGVNIEEMQE